MALRVLIADDEALARERLRSLLAAEPDLEVVGEHASGREALAAIRRERPDIVFLDVQMPGLDGVAVAESLDPERAPAVVFVTAYDRYAVRAFDLHAADYLLKPFDRERFRAALGRARSRVESAAVEELGRLSRIFETQRLPREALSRFAVRSGERTFFVEVGDIDWIEAEDNYVRLHLKGTSHLVRETLERLEERLDPRRFVRLHRSAIVAVDRIAEVRPWFRGERQVLLRDGTRLTTSRRYRQRLEELLSLS